MDDDKKGKRKMPVVDEDAQEAAAAKKGRASDAGADATDPVMFGGGAESRDSARDSPRGAVTTQGGQLVVAHPKGSLPQGGQLVVAQPEGSLSQGGLALIDVDVYDQARMAVVQQASQQLQLRSQPRGSTTIVDVVDMWLPSLPLGLQERAAASAETVAVEASANPAKAAARMADAGWHVSIPPSRNFPVIPQEECSNCGLRKGIMVDRPTPHRCLCVECLLDLEYARCRICGRPDSHPVVHSPE